MTLTHAEIREIDKRAIKLINERNQRLQKFSIQGLFSKEVVSNMGLGSKFEIIKIDFVHNLVTFKLA